MPPHRVITALALTLGLPACTVSGPRIHAPRLRGPSISGPSISPGGISPPKVNLPGVSGPSVEGPSIHPKYHSVTHAPRSIAPGPEGCPECDRGP